MKKKTITIGIPAFNEEKNILFLLSSLFNQKLQYGRIVKIHIVSDGSTDKTIEKIRLIKDKRIKIFERRTRIGVNKTENEILRNTTSDIVVLLNADIIPAGIHFLEKLIKPIIHNKKIGMVGGNISSAKPKTLFERIIVMGNEIKLYFGRNIRNGNNVYMCYGGVRAFSKDFYTKLNWPINVPEDAYSYFRCMKEGFLFQFVSDAYVTFRLPTNFSDHKKQSTRFIKGIKTLEEIFGKNIVQKEYAVPFLLYLKALIKFFIINPFTLIAYLLVTFYLRFLFKTDSVYTSKWDISLSSKKVI